MHGRRSWVLSYDLAREMCARRPHTTLVEFPHTSHNIHEADWPGYIQAIEAFLATL